MTSVSYIQWHYFRMEVIEIYIKTRRGEIALTYRDFYLVLNLTVSEIRSVCDPLRKSVLTQSANLINYYNIEKPLILFTYEQGSVKTVFAIQTKLDKQTTCL